MSIIPMADRRITITIHKTALVIITRMLRRITSTAMPQLFS
jgi:hypothetical protein